MADFERTGRFCFTVPEIATALRIDPHHVYQLCRPPAQLSVIRFGKRRLRVAEHNLRDYLRIAPAEPLPGALDRIAEAAERAAWERARGRRGREPRAVS